MEQSELGEREVGPLEGCGQRLALTQEPTGALWWRLWGEGWRRLSG